MIPIFLFCPPRPLACEQDTPLADEQSPRCLSASSGVVHSITVEPLADDDELPFASLSPRPFLRSPLLPVSLQSLFPHRAR
jgi:hypothetical protein